MYIPFLFLHSVFRWLVLFSLLVAIFRAYRGWKGNKLYTKTEDAIRHWTATIAHVQLIIGFVVYMVSPLVKFYFSKANTTNPKEPLFFGIIHISLMFIAIVIITIGSSMAKRKPTDRSKFRTQLIWFSIALLIIFLSIPWPFSPLAARPYFRPL